jgi:hypothetical protein
LIDENAENTKPEESASQEETVNDSKSNLMEVEKHSMIN